MKFLKPAETIYHSVVRIKNYLYDTRLIKTIKLGVPVLSIGNLSFGGTGKTPCIILLAEELSKHYKINIITKSYKATLRHPQKVDMNLPKAAQLFGDEACLISSKVKNCNVWSGPHKSDTALASLSDKPSLLLLDDGFSHRKLARQFDLVLIDATYGLNDYLREYKSALSRAHAVLITKINLSTDEEVRRIEKTIISLSANLKGKIYYSTSETELLIKTECPLFVFCGLAKPDSLERVLNQKGYIIIEKKYFDDHHVYSMAEQKQIFQKYAELKSLHPELRLVTSEKDFIKLSDPDLISCVDLAYHRMQINETHKGELIEKIRQTL